jgi:hypothetical protein
MSSSSLVELITGGAACRVVLAADTNHDTSEGVRRVLPGCRMNQLTG